MKYNEAGQEIYSKDSEGYEKWTEYDELGLLSNIKTSTGFEEYWEYNDAGQIIYSKDSEGYEKQYIYEGDKLIDIIWTKC